MTLRAVRIPGTTHHCGVSKGRRRRRRKRNRGRKRRGECEVLTTSSDLLYNLIASLHMSAESWLSVWHLFRINRSLKDAETWLTHLSSATRPAGLPPSVTSSIHTSLGLHTSTRRVREDKYINEGANLPRGKWCIVLHFTALHSTKANNRDDFLASMTALASLSHISQIKTSNEWLEPNHSSPLLAVSSCHPLGQIHGVTPLDISYRTWLSRDHHVLRLLLLLILIRTKQCDVLEQSINKMTWHDITWHYMTWHDITLHDIKSHDITSHDMTYYITSQNIT